jgi:phosphopantetheine adenylyltransferase
MFDRLHLGHKNIADSVLTFGAVIRKLFSDRVYNLGRIATINAFANFIIQSVTGIDLYILARSLKVCIQDELRQPL